MRRIKLKIATPERVVLEREVDQVNLPTRMGQITILANHVPLISVLEAGVLEARIGSELLPVSISGGFLEFHQNEVVILADTAEKAEEVDLQRAENAARERARELKSSVGKISDELVYARMIRRVEKQLARIKLGKNYQRRSTRRMNLD